MLTSGIYLEVGGVSRPTCDEWSRYLAAMRGAFDDHSLNLDYYLIDTFFGEARFKRFSTRAYEKRISIGFSEVDIVTFAATPSGCRDPGYNWTSLCSFTYIEGYGRLSVALMIEESSCLFGGGLFLNSVAKLANLRPWHFGWCLSRDRKMGLEPYLTGAGLGEGLNAEDRRRLGLWYDCDQPEEREKKLRDVFPYNVLSLSQLGRLLPDGRCLKDFIKADRSSELRQLSPELWLWAVNPDLIETVRQSLIGLGVIVSE